MIDSTMDLTDKLRAFSPGPRLNHLPNSHSEGKAQFGGQRFGEMEVWAPFMVRQMSFKKS